RAAAKAAAGGAAGAGTADQPRSSSLGHRHQDSVPKVRAVPRSFAGGGFGATGGRSRPQGRADRATAGVADGARWWLREDGIVAARRRRSVAGANGSARPRFAGNSSAAGEG